MDVFYEDVAGKSPERLRKEFADFQWLYAKELEAYLAARCTAPSRSWRRDYSSPAAYLESVEKNREAWHDILGRFEPESGVPEAVQTRPFHSGPDYAAEWIQFEFLPGVNSRAVVALPRSTPLGTPPPVVICQHGIGSSPFHVFGMIDDAGAYARAGLVLLEAGFAVVAPVNRTTGEGRGRLERLAHLCGVTLYGLECCKLERLIDYLETRTDLDAARLGMCGLSLGGAATLLCTPVVPRIQAACAAAWFNHRRRKMAVPDPKYSCFLDTPEYHAFIPGWLPEFSDSDLVSLICPRPFMAQVGKADAIAWWPYVLEEWQAARAHYEKLGIPERAELVLHEAGHEFMPDPMAAFFRRWLAE